MPRCFVFAIGGTGSRVLRSLTHLLAAGVKPENNDFEIIPIIIDPHQGNEDLQRAARVLDLYKKIRKESSPDPKGFFSTNICTLEDLKADGPDKYDEKTEFTFKLRGSGDKFRNYIDYSNMDLENQALADLLFSGTTKDNRGDNCELLDVQMDIGFVGNPNVGSVVLNQIVNSEIYDSFARNFKQDEDRIFIISSIFGGTGAAGFPCLLKNIREGKGAGSANLKLAKIGAVSVLPYFKLEKNEKSAINYSDFIAKTKSALYYYRKNVTGNKSINVMYYIGDKPEKSYTNDPGYNGQKNKAHFIELAGALAIINFLSIKNSDPKLQSEMKESVGRAVNPVCNEFSIQREASNPNFFDFQPESQRFLAMPLSRFALFRKYMKEQFGKEGKLQSWQMESPKIDDSFIKDNFYRDYLEYFFEDFYVWLTELNENNRGFSPFNLAEGSDLESFIKGNEIEKGFLKKVPTYEKFNECLNKFAKNKSSLKREKKVMDAFYNATDNLLDEYYKLNQKIGGAKK